MIAEYVVHFGGTDRPKNSSLTDSKQAKRLDLVGADGKLAIGLQGLLDGLDELGKSPSETAIDLLVVAASVFAADTSHDREKLAEDGWTRQFRLHIAVSEPAKWVAATDHLERMLRFLTGDFWQFDFRSRPRKYSTLVGQAQPTMLADYDVVSLFSGGLDSLVGAIDLLADARKPLLVSHSWDAQASSAQGRMMESFKSHYSGQDYEILRASIGLTSKDLLSAGTDGNQRARSFLFYGMAAVVADATGIDTVLIPENGLIALNVPMEPFRLGSLSTRTAHPFFIKSMTDLANLIGLDIKFTNPYRFKSKGQMVAECKGLAYLRTIVHQSMSCSSPAKARWSGMPPQHCGYCVPCLIRRASLNAGLGIPDQTPYGVPSLSGTFDSRTATGEHLRSFILATKRLKENPALAPFLVRKSGPLNDDEFSLNVEMYRHAMQEVADLLVNTRARHV